jgi:hypothetical protein
MDNAKLTDVPAPAEDALKFDLAGYTIGWKVDGLALKRAAERGVEVGQVLDDIQRIFAAQAQNLSDEELEEIVPEGEELPDIAPEESEEVTLSEITDVFARLIWVGALRFEPNVKREAILALVSPDVLADIPTDRMLGQLVPAAEEEMDVSGAEGKETDRAEAI